MKVLINSTGKEAMAYENAYREEAKPMKPPKIDSRGVQDLIAQMKEMVPHYTPEWRFTPEDPDPGTALFMLFSEMFQENIKRLNRVPTKNMIAFLNMFDVSLLPARPSGAYVTFSLNEGTREPVFISAGTQIAAPGEEGDLVFETERPMLLTPAGWKAAFFSSRKHDTIYRISDDFLTASRLGQASPTTLFRLQDAEDLQDHALFLENSALFTVFETAQIEIRIGNSAKRYEEEAVCEQLADPRLTEWLYASDSGWTAFDQVESKDNRLILTKSHLGEIVEREVDGHTGRWIQCRLKRHPHGVKSLAESRLSLDRIEAKTDYVDYLERGGIKPDQLFYNDIQADPTGFYPFGDQFALYGAFYLASREALSKKDGLVTLGFSIKAELNRFQPELDQQINWKMVMKKSQFDKPDSPRVSIAQVAWEYWNGNAWVRLEVKKEAEKLFYHPAEEKKQITFRCPKDLEPSMVNGHSNFWIRARILHIENAYAAQAVYLSPWLEDVALTYEYKDRMYHADRCMTLNNTEYKERTRDSWRQKGAFEPFYHLEGTHPSLYMGFDAPPVKGPISLYISVKLQKFRTVDLPLIEWEYLRSGLLPGEPPEWTSLKVLDGTQGLTQSGVLQFSGPADFAHVSLFTEEACWIRAVNRDDKYDDRSRNVTVPTINGIYMNTVRVLQQQSITGEVPEVRRDEPSVYQLSRGNVVSEQVWVDETGYVSEEDIAEYEELGAPIMEVIRDSEGNVHRLWVLWAAVRSFADSGSKDRHYVLDATYGKIRFGDGIHGMEPPKGGLEQVKVSYKVTMGASGNVEARQITNLQNSIAFVGAVTNYEQAAGGCDAESLDSAVVRGPELLKHRDRAVTSEDFEWLAREAYPNISKVKCLANYNAYMEREIGSMTLVVLPKSGLSGMLAFPELKRTIEKYILQRASSLVALPERIQVIEPVFLEVSVTTVVTVEGMDGVVPTELEAIDKLTRFLDPLHGNFDGRGWSIGQQIHPSVFYALLKTIREINYVEKLFMSVYKLEDGNRVELDVNRLPAMPHGVVISGKHKVVVNAI
jgi:hypothetical protein